MNVTCIIMILDTPWMLFYFFKDTQWNEFPINSDTFNKIDYFLPKVLESYGSGAPQQTPLLIATSHAMRMDFTFVWKRGQINLMECILGFGFKKCGVTFKREGRNLCDPTPSPRVYVNASIRLHITKISMIRISLPSVVLMGYSPHDNFFTLCLLK